MEHMKDQLGPKDRKALAQETVIQAEKDYAQRAVARPILVQLENRKQPNVITGQSEEMRLQRSQRSVLFQPLTCRNLCIQYIHHRLKANDKRSHNQGILKYVKKLCFYIHNNQGQDALGRRIHGRVLNREATRVLHFRKMIHSSFNSMLKGE